MSSPRLKNVRRDYASIAGDYEQRWRAFNQATRKWLFAHWPDQLTEQPRVLDIGCGAGGLLAALAARRPELELVGMDVSRAQLREAQRIAPSARLIEADAEHPPFLPASFDLICSLNLLHHLRDPAAHLEQIARLARRGGRVFLASFSGGRTVAMRLAQAWLTRRNPSWHQVLSMPELRAMLSRDGRFVIEAQNEIRAGHFWYLQVYRLGC